MSTSSKTIEGIPANQETIQLQWINKGKPAITDYDDEATPTFKFPVPSVPSGALDGTRAFIAVHDQWPPQEPWGDRPWDWFGLAALGILMAVLVVIAGTIVWKIWDRTIDIRNLLSEADGKASLARFQALVFTFIVGILMAVFAAQGGGWPEIPVSLLAILAGSLATYVAAKLISGGGATAVGSAVGAGGLVVRYAATAAAPVSLGAGAGESRTAATFRLPASDDWATAPKVAVALIAGEDKVVVTPKAGDTVAADVRAVTTLVGEAAVFGSPATTAIPIPNVAGKLMLVELQARSSTAGTIVTVDVA